MLDRDLGPTREPSDVNVVLTATRTGAVLDRIHLSGGDKIDPESFQRGLYPHWGILRRQGEAFLLTDRAFIQIDRFFWHLPSRLIEFYLSSPQADQVRILDIGGGRDATAAREIASRYPLAQVVNVDIVAINERRGNLTSIRGDLCDLSLPDASIDFAYSHQVLPFMRRADDFGRHIRVIDEFFRVLKVGGVGAIDFTDDSFLPGNVLRRINRRLNSQIVPKRKSYGGEFLLITKNPIDSAVIAISARVPDLTVYI